jgi:hypothetical protein
MATPLPQDQSALTELDDRCADALFACRATLDALRSLRDDPGTFVPGRFVPLDLGLGREALATLVTGIDPRRSLNEDITAATRRFAALIPHLTLREAATATLKDQVTKLAPEGANVPMPGRRLEGLWVVDSSPPDNNGAEANDLRLAALIPFFETAESALAEMRQRVVRKLYPPQIKDRVKVNRTTGEVTVDDRSTIEGVNQAILIYHLAAANGVGLSRTEIAEREGVEGGFRAGRYRKAIKTPWLRSPPMPRERSTYTAEFKLQAVKRVDALEVAVARRPGAGLLALGPGQPVRRRPRPAGAGECGDHVQHERGRPVPGQRPGRELLRPAEV